jgi:hypothetical protein
MTIDYCTDVHLFGKAFGAHMRPAGDVVGARSERDGALFHRRLDRIFSVRLRVEVTVRLRPRGSQIVC